MMLLDKWRENEERVKQAGRIALDRAKIAGVPVYYRDPALEGGIVKELPDGRRVLVQLEGDEERVMANLGPRG